MSDLISRQAAIAALSTITMYEGSIPFDTAVMRIEQLPSAQPKPKTKWIPCSERLPEDDDDVIITTGFEIYVGWFDADDHTWRLRNDYIIGIVAWMPLPEPYKAESEVEE